MRNRKEVKKSQPLHFSSHLLIDHDNGLYVQDFFNERLYLERRRTERSKTPFLLVLLNIEEAVRSASNRDKMVFDIASTLFSVTREIDLKGWYRYSSVVGIIFTEISPSLPKQTKENILHKIFGNLSKRLTGDQLKKIKTSFHFYPEIYEIKKEDISFDRSLYPDLVLDRSRKILLFFKRATDITGSLAALIFFFPLILLISLGVKISSQGPVLFKQERVGLFGKKFMFMKFRSMYVNTDPRIHREYIKLFISGRLHEREDSSRSGSAYKLRGDPRITPLGRLLRKTSLDELPQFVNVLKGDMSLVGPRPPIPYECKDYDVWHRSRILNMKPGITGLWQIKGRSATSFDDMVRLDLKYIKTWSLWLDLVILLKTPWAVLSCRGAY